MTEEDEENFKDESLVIFVIKNILLDIINKLEIMIIIQDSIWVVLIESVIQNSLMKKIRRILS